MSISHCLNVSKALRSLDVGASLVIRYFSKAVANFSWALRHLSLSSSVISPLVFVRSISLTPSHSLSVAQSSNTKSGTPSSWTSLRMSCKNKCPASWSIVERLACSYKCTIVCGGVLIVPSLLNSVGLNSVMPRLSERFSSNLKSKLQILASSLIFMPPKWAEAWSLAAYM